MSKPPMINLCTLVVLLFVGTATAGAETRTIVVGVCQNPPVIFADAEGRVQGIAADLLKYIAGREGWKLEYRHGTWAQCTQRLADGAIDLLPGLAGNPAWNDRFRLNRESIAENWGHIYVSPDFAYTDILAFDGRDIAVVEADVYYQYLETILEKFNIHPRFVRVQDYADVLSLVSRQKVAGGVVSRLYGLYHEKRYRVKRSPISFHPTELHFAVVRTKDTAVIDVLDTHLQQLKTNPNSIFYQSQDRWTQGVRKITVPLWLKPLWVISAVGGIVLLIVIGNIFLRRQVRIQTEALKQTIAEKEKIESDLAVAKNIQQQLVPESTHPFPHRKEFDIHAALQPAREVGGDFYDVFFIDRNALCIVVGDVSGKGVPAALFMAMTKTMIKSAARLLIEPEYILADVNREISRNNPSLTFVTVFFAVLDLSTGLMTYASGGHNPPIFIGKKGNTLLLGEAQCPALGLDDSFKYHQASVQLHHGEGVLLFSDGVIEAEDGRGHSFTQEALMTTVSQTAGLSARNRVEAVLSGVRGFTGEQPLDDDVTLLALTYFSPQRVETPLKTLYLKNDIGEMERITEAISDVADRNACPLVVVQDATLAIEEIFSNIVFYGFGDDLDHTITFTIAIEKNDLVLILQDEGIPFNPLNVQASFLEKSLEDHDKGGMGIVLARNLMDRMAYRRERGKNILRMEKRFQ